MKISQITLDDLRSKNAADFFTPNATEADSFEKMHERIKTTIETINCEKKELT